MNDKVDRQKVIYRLVSMLETIIAVINDNDDYIGNTELDLVWAIESDLNKIKKELKVK